MNVDWGSRTGAGGYADPAFPALDAVLAPIVAGRDPVAVYYYPGRTLQVVHQDERGGLVTRDAVPAGATPDGLRPDAVPPDAVPPGERWDAALRCVVREFPHDPGLPALAAVVAWLGATPQDVLSYLPGSRAVLRSAAADGATVTKLGAPEPLRRNHDRHVALFRAGRRYGLRLSEPLAIDPAGAWRRERLLPGSTLVRALEAGADPVMLAAGVADQLAALHAVPGGVVPQPVDHRAPVLLDRWGRKAVRKVARALPGLEPRMRAVVERLAQWQPAGLADPAAAGAVHGDLHVANLLVGPGGPVLLDLDEAGLGDPELDLAVLTGRLLLVAGRVPGALRAEVATFTRALVPRYDAEAAGRGRPALRPEVLAWYLAGTMLGRQARTCVGHLAPDLARCCAVLVTLAERSLDLLAGPVPAGGRPDAAAVLDDLLGQVAATAVAGD